MKKKVIASILIVFMLTPVFFTTANLAYEADKENSSDSASETKSEEEAKEGDNTKSEQIENMSKTETESDEIEDTNKTNTEKNETVKEKEQEIPSKKEKTETDNTKSQNTKKDDEKDETVKKEENKEIQLMNNYALTSVSSSKLENGTYRITSKSNQQKVFQVEGKSTENSKKVKLANKLSISMSQNVIVKYLNNGYYSLTFEHSKKVLDVPGASKARGTVVQQYSSNGSAAQQWILKSDGQGYYSIISRCNGLYLDIPSGKAVTGANLQLYTGNNTDAQKFKFEKVQEPQSEKTIEEGLYYISSAASSNKVLTIENGKTANSANLHIGDKGKQHQKFQVSYNSSLKAYTITAFHSNKVLDVAGAGQANGTNVQQYAGNKTKAQQWIIQKTEDGYYSIISKCNYLYLDLSAGSTRNGTNIQMYEPNNTKAQKFKFEKIPSNTCEKVLSDGVYKISSALNSQKVLDISGGSNNNGANLQLWKTDNVQQQKFKITYNSSGKYYEIIAVHSQKALDVASNGKTEGTNVWQYGSNHTDAQKWILKDAGNGYFYIIASYSGMYLDVAAASTANGTNVQVYSGNNTKAQKFKFTKIKTIDNANYQILIKQNNNKVLDIAGGSYEEDANLQIWDKDSVSQQIFNIKSVDDTYYKLIAKHSKKVLTVKNNNVVQSTDNNTDNQEWTIESIGNGYYKIKSKATGLYLDVSNNKTANGTNVQVCQGNSSPAQQFKLNKINEKTGIDVSFYQNLINWNTVSKTAYSDFAMIRAGYRGYGSAGTLVTDSQFLNNVKGAKANNIDIGLYFFTQAVNTAEAVQEANYVLGLIQLAKTYGVNITYPIAIDTETANGGAGRADQLDVGTRTAVCKAFCDTIRTAGYTPAIYASRDWFYNNLDINQLRGYDIWVAHYTGSVSNKTNYKYDYDMWQYTSSGRVNGISGNVDLDICYKNY